MIRSSRSATARAIRAALLAEELTRKNRERQAIEQIIDSDVSEMLEKDQSLIYDRVIVIAGEKWNGGVIGIFASRICERYGKPCFIISYEGDKAKGSGRSIEGFSLHDAISACSEHLTGFGGHTLAAGINLNTDKIDSFRRAINEYAARKYPVMPSPVLRIDCQLPPSAITMQLCTASQLLEPFVTLSTAAPVAPEVCTSMIWISSVLATASTI